MTLPVVHLCSTAITTQDFKVGHRGSSIRSRTLRSENGKLQTFHTIPPIMPLTSDTPRLHQHVSRSPVARRHANALPTQAAQIPMALQHHERNFAARSAHTLEAYHMIPPIIPLTSDTPHLHHHVSRSPVARRHAHTLPTQAAQILMARRHQERNFATRSVHTLEANISHDSTNHPHVSRSSVARRHANTLPTKAAQIPMALRHHERNFATRSAHTLEAKTYHVIPPIIPLTSDTPRLHQHVSRSPVARRHANALPTKAAQLPMALRRRERNFATWSAHTLQAFRMKRPPKVMRTVSKTSVS